MQKPVNETTISIIDDEIISGGKALDLSGNPKATNKNGLPMSLRCGRPDEICDCPYGTCRSAVAVVRTCQKCNATASAFNCSTPGCPVNGGAAYA